MSDSVDTARIEALSGAPGAARTPSAWHVVRAISQREIQLALKRRLLKLLFLGSLVPPLVFTVILVVKMVAETATGIRLDWNPLLRFLEIQALPVALLALGLGTPSVARDRAEDVLFLYATRPVLPQHYVLGKILAVAVPSFALLLIPGILIAVLRLSVTGDLDPMGAVEMVGKIALAAAAMGWGFAGVSVGPSAAVKRGRWALLLALAFFVIPDAVAGILGASDHFPAGPGSALTALLESMFGGERSHGLLGLVVLLVYGAAGYLVASLQVRKEMIP